MSVKLLIFFMAVVLNSQTQCTQKTAKEELPTGPTAPADMEAWMTTADQSVLLQKQSGLLRFGTVTNGYPNVTLDSTQQFQTVDGFGYTLTSGSATLINSMSADNKAKLLMELFSNGSQADAIGISYLRIAIGASDLSATVYSYNDVPTGQTDLTLSKFSLAPDQAAGTGLIPLLKEILAINPQIKILATPWSPPVWMKDNASSVGGSLKPEYYEVYANYFVKYIQAMKAEGIVIDAITPQNEPLHPGNNPSLLMIAEAQRDFIKGYLGPAFQKEGLSTKIITYDHNCDRPDYPLTILNDPAAKAFVNGSAFHLYAGNVSALSTVHNAHPDKAVYFTEQWTGSKGTFDGDLKWHTKNVIIGTMRNWSRVALEWNLASDPNFDPHTPGGCTECKGALTLSGNNVTRNVAYYIIAQASKFVPSGSVRVASTEIAGLATAGFVTPEGKKVLIVLNEGSAPVNFNIQFKDKWIATGMPAASVCTFSWK